MSYSVKELTEVVTVTSLEDHLALVKNLQKDNKEQMNGVSKGFTNAFE